MRWKDKLELLVRRAAARCVGNYPAPALAGSEALKEELLSAVRLGPAGSEWAGFAADIRQALNTSGANRFLRLPPIARTLHSRQRSHTRRYLEYVTSSPKFSAHFQRALTESPVGLPLVNPHYPLSSPLLVQHGYHVLRLMEATDLKLTALRLVVEFGGGYGSFFRLLRNLGYRESYAICDLPVMCALQRFYLRNVFPGERNLFPGEVQGLPQNLQWISGEEYSSLAELAARGAPSLFVATWSLSETPLEVRQRVAAVLPQFTHVLIAYQRRFGDHDNVEYFTSLQGSLPQFSWLHAECPVYGNNFYLIGRRTT